MYIRCQGVSWGGKKLESRIGFRVELSITPAHICFYETLSHVIRDATVIAIIGVITEVRLKHLLGYIVL
jgi:hypothetical protein